jgi:hypothetical protein
MSNPNPSDLGKTSVSAEEMEFESAGGKLEREQVEHVSGDVLMISGNDKVRRIPIPSDDPNDPLKFSKWKKMGIVFTCCWFCEFKINLPLSTRFSLTRPQPTFL